MLLETVANMKQGDLRGGGQMYRIWPLEFPHSGNSKGNRQITWGSKGGRGAGERGFLWTLFDDRSPETRGIRNEWIPI